MRSPLHIVLLYHPDSSGARALAERLVAALYGPPATLELRVPTWLTPAPPAGAPPPLHDLWTTGGDRTMLVYLMDARMARRVDGGTADAWAAHFVDAMAAAGLTPKTRTVVPLALDWDAFDLLPAENRRSVRRLPDAEALDAALQHIAIRALYLLSERSAPDVDGGRLQIPIQVFLSHAKADLNLASPTDPVRCLMDELRGHAVEQFFDSARIAPGEDFEQHILPAVIASDVVVVVFTDHWSGRPWCRRELVAAKRAGRSLVVVDALSEAVIRAFPYVGNATWLRWRGDTSAPSPSGPTEFDRFRAGREAARVLTCVVLAALRARFERTALGDAPDDAHTLHLGSAPEALDFADRADVTTFVYPDPPLPDDERALLAGLGNRRLLTPLTRVACEQRARCFTSVAVSVSTPGPEEVARLGVMEHHIATVTDEVHLGVLLSGRRIVYGGLLSYASAGSTNFVERLFGLVRRYADLAADAGCQGPFRIVNTPPWPLFNAYGEREINLFGKIADLQRGAAPSLGTLSYESFPAGRFPTIDSAERLLAIGMGLRQMRRETTWDGPASEDGRKRPRPRLLAGGPLKSMGWLPGLVEEAYCSLIERAPLFLMGGLGGAAELVVALLRGDAHPGGGVMTEERARDVVTVKQDGVDVAVYDTLQQLALTHGLPFETRTQVAEAIRSAGTSGLAAALNNGLDDAENAELTTTRDGRRIQELVLRGLARLEARAGGA